MSSLAQQVPAPLSPGDPHPHPPTPTSPPPTPPHPHPTPRGDGWGSQHLHPSPGPAEVGGLGGAPRRGPLTVRMPTWMCCVLSPRPRDAPSRSGPWPAACPCGPSSRGSSATSGCAPSSSPTCPPTSAPCCASASGRCALPAGPGREGGGRVSSAFLSLGLCTQPSTLEVTLRGTVRTPGDRRGDGARRGERTPCIPGLLRDRAPGLCS